MEVRENLVREAIEEICTSGPLLKVVAAAFAMLTAITMLEWRTLTSELHASLVAVAFVVGAVYTQLFEYAYHRFPMHERVPGFASARANHLRHHAIFHGEHFATRNREYLNHVAGKWYHFPVGLLAHYLVLAPFVGSACLVAFLAGVMVHYLLFEASHWFAHLDASAVDRAVALVPVLSTLRRRQIRHHRGHHDRPNVDFNFNPPFIGDRVAGLVEESYAAGALNASRSETASHVALNSGTRRSRPRPVTLL